MYRILSVRFLLVMLLAVFPFAMTVPLHATVNESTPANRYSGNGSTTAFTFTWKIFTKNDIAVLVDTATKIVDVEYTVTGFNSDSGGTVTFVTAPASGTVVTLLRNQPASQLSDYQPNEAFPAQRLETDYDKLVMEIQQARELASRSYHVPASEPGTAAISTIPSLASRANKYAAWNSSGEPIATDPASASGTSVLATGSTTARLLADWFADTGSSAGWGLVGNGVADNATNLQTLLNWGSTNSKTIEILPGTYMLGTVVTYQSNLHVKCLGAPGTCIFKLTAGHSQSTRMFDAFTGSPGLDTYGQTNVTFSGITFDGNKANRSLSTFTELVHMQSIDGLTIVNCTFKSHEFTLLRLAGVKNVTLRGLTFTDWERPGSNVGAGVALLIRQNIVDLTKSSRIRASNLVFRDAEYAAMYNNGNDTIFDGVLIYNVFENQISSAGGDPALTPSNQIYTNVYISNVGIKNTRGTAVELQGNNLILSHFVISDVEGSAVSVNSLSNDVTISDGHIWNTGTALAAGGEGQIRLKLAAGGYNNNLTIHDVRIGRSDVAPIAHYAIYMSSSGPEFFSNVQIHHVNATNGYDTAFFFESGNPFDAADLTSSITDNIGASYVREPRLVTDTPRVKFFDDFLGNAIDSAKWTTAVGTDPQCAAATLPASARGLMQMTFGDDAGGTMALNGAQLSTGLNWTRGMGFSGLTFDASVKTNVITDVALFVGLTDQVSALEMPFTLAAGDALTSNATDAVGFLFDTAADTDTVWLVGVATDVDATKQNTGIAYVAGTELRLRIQVLDTGVATFYINGVQVGTSMTGAVGTTIKLAGVIAGFSRTNATRLISADFVWLESERQ